MAFPWQICYKKFFVSVIFPICLPIRLDNILGKNIFVYLDGRSPGLVSGVNVLRRLYRNTRLGGCCRCNLRFQLMKFWWIHYRCRLWRVACWMAARLLVWTMHSKQARQGENWRGVGTSVNSNEKYTGRSSLWQVVHGLFFHILVTFWLEWDSVWRGGHVWGHPCEHFLWNFKPFDKSSCQSFTSCHRRLSCGKSEDLMLIIKERLFSVAVDIVWLFAWSTIFQTVTLKLYFKFHIIPLQLLVLLNFKLRQFHFILSNAHCTATQHV